MPTPLLFEELSNDCAYMNIVALLPLLRFGQSLHSFALVLHSFVIGCKCFHNRCFHWIFLCNHNKKVLVWDKDSLNCTEALLFRFDLLTIFAWANADGFLEYPAKIIGIFVAYLITNLLQT